jgi:hypothetical protein
MLKKSASGVLALLRGSTYGSVRLVSSLAAALLDDLFEHPAHRSACAGKRITPLLGTNKGDEFLVDEIGSFPLWDVSRLGDSDES